MGCIASEVPRLRLVAHQDFTFAPGVEVTEIDQVKGLEFDYVVLVEVSAAQFPDTPAMRRLLHVGATRAVHQLWLTSVGTPSPVVRERSRPSGTGGCQDRERGATWRGAYAENVRPATDTPPPAGLHGCERRLLDAQLDAPILRAPILGLVARDRTRLTVADVLSRLREMPPRAR